MFAKKPTLLTATGLLLFVGGLTGQNRFRDAEMMIDRSFEIGAGGLLQVDVPDGDVLVTTRGGSGVEVEVWAAARDMAWAREVVDRMEFEVVSSSNGVSVTALDPRIRRAEWRENRGIRVEVRISIPERFNLDVKTADGDIEIGNVQGSVDLSTSDGDVTLGDLIGPRLMVRTSDGDVIVGTTRTDVLDVRSSDGDIRLAAAVGSVRLKTSDGDIDARQLSGSIRLETHDGDIWAGFDEITGATVNTHDGDIVMFAPENLAADVSFEGEDLSLDRDVVVQGTVSRRRITGTINGGGPSINARTNDGSIRLRSGRSRGSRSN